MAVPPLPPDCLTNLLDVLHRFTQGFTVGHLRTTDICLDAKLTLHAVDDNPKV